MAAPWCLDRCEAATQVRGATECACCVQVPSFTITKLLWLKRHEPDVWAKVTSVLLPHDYMNFWLTGRKVTEVSGLQ